MDVCRSPLTSSDAETDFKPIIIISYYHYYSEPSAQAGCTNRTGQLSREGLYQCGIWSIFVSSIIARFAQSLLVFNILYTCLLNCNYYCQLPRSLHRIGNEKVGLLRPIWDRKFIHGQHTCKRKIFSGHYLLL